MSMELDTITPGNQDLNMGSKPERFIEITVILTQIIRTTVEVFQPQKSIITKEGVKDSVRKPSDGFFKIGRQQITESGHRPNDLMLPPSDRAISRSHCQIDYKSFFHSTSSESWYSFLMSLHPRLGRNSILQYLPIEIFKYIFLFIKEPQFPLLIDLGSMCGTFIKVSNFEETVLTQGLNFLVGSDINIEIDRVENEYGKKDEECKLNETLFGGANDQGYLPYIIIKVSKTFPDNEATVNVNSWKFEATKDKYKFNIGRSQNCDINLPENTISRVQCRVFYHEKQWKLLDGTEGKPTVNGTWLSICKKNSPIREESKPYPLKNGSQIKISDTILQVDWN